MDKAGAIARRRLGLAAHGQHRLLEHGHGREHLHGQEVERVRRRLSVSQHRCRFRSQAASYLEVAPLFLILLLSLVGLPLAMVVVVSFWNYDDLSMYPAFTFQNYIDVLTSETTWRLYYETLKYAVPGLAAHAADRLHRRLLPGLPRPNILLADRAFPGLHRPFWTSNIIRMISWIPFLGRNGILNQLLMGARHHRSAARVPAVLRLRRVLAYVHLFTLFMLVPIFNSMARIDPSLIEAAYDAGAKPWQVLWRWSFPLCRTGIALGSIFVVALVMGDFFAVRVMAAARAARSASAMSNQIANLSYPLARRERRDADRHCPPDGRRRSCGSSTSARSSAS